MEKLNSLTYLWGEGIETFFFFLFKGIKPQSQSLARRQAGPRTEKLLHVNIGMMLRLIIKAVKVRDVTLDTSHVSKYHHSKSSAIFGSLIYNPIFTF